MLQFLKTNRDRPSGKSPTANAIPVPDYGNPMK